MVDLISAALSRELEADSLSFFSGTAADEEVEGLLLLLVALDEEEEGGGMLSLMEDDWGVESLLERGEATEEDEEL